MDSQLRGNVRSRLRDPQAVLGALRAERFSATAFEDLPRPADVLALALDLAILDVLLPSGNGFDLARLLRRRGAIPQVLEVEGLLVDEEHGFAARHGRELALTATELRLLVFLMRHRGQALSKDQLLTQVWGYYAYDHNLVEVHISALRRKLEATGVGGGKVIHTVPGIGYRFSP